MASAVSGLSSVKYQENRQTQLLPSSIKHFGICVQPCHDNDFIHLSYISYRLLNKHTPVGCVILARKFGRISPELGFKAALHIFSVGPCWV